MNSSMDHQDASDGACGFTTHLDILREMPIFTGLSLDVLKVLAYLSSNETCRDGDRLCVQGEMFDSCRYITMGRVEILRAPENGTAAVVGTAGGGWTFGGLALLTHVKSLYTIRAKGDVECLVLSREKFQKAAERFPQVLPRVLHAVVEHMFSWEAKVLSALERNAATPEEVHGLTLF
ncbi:Crp/Fnr family transcriptional regulator [Desulfolutivibrio sp.]|uniref:Crp/Fnr family transcriptional regulator n=1 Tax=Desulfolutivibrio sp. TaxID=2773296 RepID=UPI002F9686EC